MQPGRSAARIESDPSRAAGGPARWPAGTARQSCLQAFRSQIKPTQPAGRPAGRRERPARRTGRRSGDDGQAILWARQLMAGQRSGLGAGREYTMQASRQPQPAGRPAGQWEQPARPAGWPAGFPAGTGTLYHGKGNQWTASVRSRGRAENIPGAADNGQPARPAGQQPSGMC